MAGGKKNRRQGAEPRHIRLYHTVTGCDAWLKLSGNATKLLVAMLRFENGLNNGLVIMGARTAAKLIGVSKNTAHKLLVELDGRCGWRP